MRPAVEDLPAGTAGELTPSSPSETCQCGPHNVIRCRPFRRALFAEASRPEAVSLAGDTPTPDGVVHMLEVNVCPGLTDTSLLPTAVAAAGEHLGQR